MEGISTIGFDLEINLVEFLKVQGMASATI